LEAPQRELRPSADAAKPNFILQTVRGAPADLSRHAGRVVLVHFFATWCEPCREELASLNQLVARRDSDLSVLAVNVAEVRLRVSRFLATTPVIFPVLLDTDRTVTKAWGVNVLPTTFVLDRSLVPRLWVEGDLDWTRADVLAALDGISGVLRR
jgi:thiol-disulfide isomerase/thioredoxin